jgi:hypothetical protein
VDPWTSAWQRESHCGTWRLQVSCSTDSMWILKRILRESQWRNGSASIFNARGLEFDPHQGQGFSRLYKAPNDLGLVTLTCFGWDDKPRPSVCTHSEHPAHTIKILLSLCVSYKIVETYRNQHAPKFSKKEKGNDAPIAALTSLISGYDTFWEQARTLAKHHEHSIEWICAL